MYDSFALENAIESTIDGTKAKSSDDWKPQLVKILIGILMIFLFAEFVFYIIIVPTTSKIHLTLSGAPSLGYDELCSMAGLSGHEKWFKFNSAATASRLAMNPLFESVVVEKKFPDRVNISLKERVTVAVAFGEINGRTVPLEIDRNGIAFRMGRNPENQNIPLITGLTFENPVPGMRLHAALKPLLEQLSELEKKNPVLLASISEIQVETKTYGGFDLVVYPVHTPIRVRTDKALNEDALQYMMLVLDVVQDLSLNIEEIDIRAGTVAYRLKGEQL